MKNLFLIILLVSCLSALAEPKEVPKRTYKIIVKNELSADENFSLVGRTLIENDWLIESKDKDFYTIKTGIKQMYKMRSGSYFLTFAIKEKSISVTGQCSPDVELDFGGVRTDKTYFKICYKGMNGSIDKDAFIKMAEFTKKLGAEFDFVTE